MKESIITIGIILVILILDITSQKYTENVVKNMNEYLENLRQDIQNEDISKLKDDVENINNKWDEYSNTLSIYIEHDELEKVETYLSGFKSYVKTQEKEMALNDFDKTEFILEHISNKYKLTIENIF